MCNFMLAAVVLVGLVLILVQNINGVFGDDRLIFTLSIFVYIHCYLLLPNAH